MTSKENLADSSSSSSESQYISAIVDALSDKGEGIVFKDDLEIYIKGAVPDDEVLIRCGKPFAEGSKRCPGEIVELIKPSADRQKEDLLCKYISSCGGCPLGGLNTAAQHRFKMKLIDDALIKAGVTDVKQQPFVGTCSEIYRHKSIRFFANDKSGVIQGFYQSRSHEVCEIECCTGECAWFTDLACEICALADNHNVKAYDEISAQGQIRALMMRDCGENERLAVLTSYSSLPDIFQQDLVQLFKKHHIKAGFIQLNENAGNRIISGRLKALTVAQNITAEIGGYTFDVGPQTFLQVNYDIARKLYAAAIKWCGDDMGAEALDLCCGCGTMTLPLARHFLKVTGVEIVQEATDAALHNARRAGVTNAEFIAADLKAVLPQLSKRNIKAVIADPPRAGLGDANCRALKALPQGTHLAVIFCGLKALSRDVASLIKAGFKLQAVQCFDMFPNAYGCETLCLFTKS